MEMSETLTLTRESAAFSAPEIAEPADQFGSCGTEASGLNPLERAKRDLFNGQRFPRVAKSDVFRFGARSARFLSVLRQLYRPVSNPRHKHYGFQMQDWWIADKMGVSVDTIKRIRKKLLKAEAIEYYVRRYQNSGKASRSTTGAYRRGKNIGGINPYEAFMIRPDVEKTLGTAAAWLHRMVWNIYADAGRPGEGIALSRRQAKTLFGLSEGEFRSAIAGLEEAGWVSTCKKRVRTIRQGRDHFDEVLCILPSHEISCEEAPCEEAGATSPPADMSGMLVFGVEIGPVVGMEKAEINVGEFATSQTNVGRFATSYTSYIENVFNCSISRGMDNLPGEPSASPGNGNISSQRRTPRQPETPATRNPGDKESLNPSGNELPSPSSLGNERGQPFSNETKGTFVQSKGIPQGEKDNQPSCDGGRGSLVLDASPFQSPPDPQAPKPEIKNMFLNSPSNHFGTFSYDAKKRHWKRAVAHEAGVVQVLAKTITGDDEEAKNIAWKSCWKNYPLVYLFERLRFAVYFEIYSNPARKSAPFVPEDFADGKMANTHVMEALDDLMDPDTPLHTFRLEGEPRTHPEPVVGFVEMIRDPMFPRGLVCGAPTARGYRKACVLHNCKNMGEASGTEAVKFERGGKAYYAQTLESLAKAVSEVFPEALEEREGRRPAWTTF